MKMTELIVDELYTDGFGGIRKVLSLSISKVPKKIVRVSYKVVADSQIKQNNLFAGRVQSCDLIHLAQWAKAHINEKECQYILDSAAIKKLCLTQSEQNMMLDLFDNTDYEFDLSSRTTKNLIRKNLLTDKGESLFEFTDLGLLWLSENKPTDFKSELNEPVENHAGM